jgi:hypothetical protein
MMNPSKYDVEHALSFHKLLEVQNKIRRRVAILARSLTVEAFDAEEFEDEIGNVVKALKHDPLLAELVRRVSDQADTGDKGLFAAKEALAYISENYRIESRIIRNRRAHLDAALPERDLDTSLAIHRMLTRGLHWMPYMTILIDIYKNFQSIFFVWNIAEF